MTYKFNDEPPLNRRELLTLTQTVGRALLRIDGCYKTIPNPKESFDIGSETDEMFHLIITVAPGKNDKPRFTFRVQPNEIPPEGSVPRWLTSVDLWKEQPDGQWHFNTNQHPEDTMGVTWTICRHMILTDHFAHNSGLI